MSRKGMFVGIVPEAPRDPADRNIPEAFQRGPIAAIGMELRQAAGKALVDLDPDQIEEGPLLDRMDIRDEDIRELRESILKVGQQVPILVRPKVEDPDRYEVVYGRRRLHAMRGLEGQIRCLVRSMSDEEVMVARGQENALRQDPSFIEKALYARSLIEMGYSQTAVAESLSVDRTLISRMTGVLEAIPDAVIRTIGPAHGIGRGNWSDLALRFKAFSGSLDEVLADDLDELDSDRRFQKVLSRVSPKSATSAQKKPVRSVVSDAGELLGEIRSSGRDVTLKVDFRKSPDFGAWLDAHAGELLRDLHKTFLQSRKD